MLAGNHLLPALTIARQGSQQGLLLHVLRHSPGQCAQGSDRWHRSCLPAQSMKWRSRPRLPAAHAAP